MEQTEVKLLVEQLIPVYHTEEFEDTLEHLTFGEPPSAKLIVKMELKRIMALCTKSIDLRGKVNGECREYELNGKNHWLDDVAINAYHKVFKHFGSYTEGVYEALNNTHNNFRVMQKNNPHGQNEEVSEDAIYLANIVKLGIDLQRQENRLKLGTQVRLILPNKQKIHGLTVDISNSGIKLKVPSAFDYHLGETIHVQFGQLAEKSNVAELKKLTQYRVLGVDECLENDSIRWLRLLKLSNHDYVGMAIDRLLKSTTKKTLHDHQDKILRTKTRGYEHIHLRNSANLPLFFSGTELKFAMLTETNHSIWTYWHDERNQQNFGSLFNENRMKTLIREGLTNSSNVIYSFKHKFKNKSLFYSMMLPEASIQERQLFWHMGAKKKSWKVFRIDVYELLDEEIRRLAQADPSRCEAMLSITHMAVLVELSNHHTASDYLLTEKPAESSNALNEFRHSRKIIGAPNAIYFDSRSRRKEPRYDFKTPLTVNYQQQSIQAVSLNFSNRGLSVRLAKPLDTLCDETLYISFEELQYYNDKVNLNNLPYKVVRIDPHYQIVHLAIEENNETRQSLNFLNTLISHNKSKLIVQKESIPSRKWLESIHQILLSRVTCIPFFVEKYNNKLQPRTVGVNFPLKAMGRFLHSLGNREQFSLALLLKGRSNTLMAAPMRPATIPRPHYHEIYISIIKAKNKRVKIRTKLFEEFEDVTERIEFIKKAKSHGSFLAIRISGSPVSKTLTTLLKHELEEIAIEAIHHARALEQEFLGLVGYGELVDITDEILIRLELT